MTALWAEGCGIALSGDEHEVSVTGFTFSVIWHDRHSADWLAALATPYPAAPDFPLCRGQNKTPRNIPFISRSTVSTGYSAPRLRGKGSGASHQRGGSPSPARAVVKVLIYDGAEGAVPPQWNGTSYLPRAEPSTRPGGVSRSRTEPLAPRAKGPAAPSTLTPVRACQPSGILESTAPVPIPTAPKGA